MTTIAFHAQRKPRHSLTRRLARLPAELIAREPRLARFGFVLVAFLIPMAIAALVDDRTLRGANVWIKPMKFAASVALLAWTTTWFVGHLPAARRTGPAVDRIVWLLIGAGTFELVNIALQAALGQGSHYNVGDPFHATMYALMGIGALILTATQPLLAWQLHRHPDASKPAAYRLAILIGLVLTFGFGAGIGGLLSAMQPPSHVPTLPIFGWSLAGGDLRPAHFVGIHAEQVLPLIGLVATTWSRHASRLVWVSTVGYALLFAALVTWSLTTR